MYGCVHVCSSACVHAHVCVHECACMSVSAWVCVHECACMSVCAWVCVHECACMCVRACMSSLWEEVPAKVWVLSGHSRYVVLHGDVFMKKEELETLAVNYVCRGRGGEERSRMVCYYQYGCLKNIHMHTQRHVHRLQMQKAMHVLTTTTFLYISFMKHTQMPV